MSVKLASNSSESTSSGTIGVVSDASISAGGTGTINFVLGEVSGLNLGAYTDGATLYLGATAGSVTSTKPYAPNHLVYVGIVERANSGNGIVYVKVQNGMRAGRNPMTFESPELRPAWLADYPRRGYDSLRKNATLTAGTDIADHERRRFGNGRHHRNHRARKRWHQARPRLRLRSILRPVLRPRVIICAAMAPTSSMAAISAW